MERAEPPGDPLAMDEWKSGPDEDRLAVLRTLLDIPQLGTAQLNSLDSEGRTALHEAASLQFVDPGSQHGSTSAVRLLVDAKAAVTVVDHSGQTALHVALRASQKEAAALLETVAPLDSAAAAASS
jgi:ankyrin repeat protein